MRSAWRWRRTLQYGVLPIVCVAALAALGTVAFACTSVMGPLTFSPVSGSGGTVITTSATGLKVYPAQYAMHFTKLVGGDCMSFSGVVTLKTITTDAQGAWSNVPIRIPQSAKQGTHGVCGMEVYPIKGGTATSHDVFTVT